MPTYVYTDDARGDGTLGAVSSSWGFVHFDVADIDLDGYEDIIALEGVFPPTPNSPHPIHLWINDGNGNYSDQTAGLIAGATPATTFVGTTVIDDFNGDGRPDILMGDFGYDDNVQPGALNVLLLSTPAGGFVNASANLSDTPLGSYTVAAGDIDGDGDLDIFDSAIGPRISDTETEGPMLLLNDGSGDFSEVSTRLPGSVTNRIELGGIIYLENRFYASLLTDLDNDGAAELILGPERDGGPQVGQPVIYWNDGTGNFSDADRTFLAATPFGAANSEYERIYATDLNADGFTDLVVLGHSTDANAGYSIQIHINNQNGTFSDETATRLPVDASGTGGTIGKLKLVDFDLDGDIDIVGLNFGASDVNSRPVLWVNNGSGVFSEVHYWSSLGNSARPTEIVLAPGGNGYDFLFMGLDPGSGNAFYVTFSADHDFTAPRTIDGDNGFDQIIGGNNADTINGHGGPDFLFGQGGNDILNGGAASDTLDGGDGDDRLVASTGDDMLVGGDGADDLFGQDGEDMLFGGPGDDLLNGGNQTDTVNYSAVAGAITANLQSGMATGEGSDTLTSLENIFGGDLGDTLTGNGGANELLGRDGADTLNGAAGSDRLLGGNQDDDLSGGGGDDQLFGQNGNDELAGGAGNDLINGGGGTDTADFSGAPGALTVRLLAGTATGEGVDSLAGIENAIGGAFADVIVGQLGANEIQGRDGADTLNGAAGADRLVGGNQDDTLNGSNGDDELFGQEGDDTLIGGFGDDALNGGNGTDTYQIGQPGGAVTVNLLTGAATGAAGTDTLVLVENIIGSNGTDTYTGSDVANRITGANGNDTIEGMGGADVIFGQLGNDIINGGAGDDTLNGGNGNDIFIVQNGTGSDIAIGFVGGAGIVDRVDVSDFTGITDFTDLSNNHIMQVGAHTVITLDADDTLTLNNVTASGLVADDFIF